MNQEDFDKLKKNLIDHHINFIGNACTSHPSFVVQVRKIVCGFEEDQDYDFTELYDCGECESYKDLKEYVECNQEDPDFIKMFLDFMREDMLESELVDKTCVEVLELYLEDFGSEHSVIDHLQLNNIELLVSRCKYYWEDKTVFLDRESAERYIGDSKEHRVFVKSNYMNQQYRDLIDAIITGKLIFKGE